MPGELPTGPVREVPARHLSWQACLVLGHNGRLQHKGQGSLGTYIESGEMVFVTWDDWPPDFFVRRDAGLTDYRLLEKAETNPARPLRFVLAGHDVDVARLVVAAPGSGHLLEIRPATSDVSVFQAVFLEQEYGLSLPPQPMTTIVDLGANIGFASVFLSTRFPMARVIAVEPDKGNYDSLCRNIRGLPNITPVHGAIWADDRQVMLGRVAANGAKVEDWAFQTSAVEAGDMGDRVDAFSLGTLMHRYGLDTIDLLKVDIEGAELELFSSHTGLWLPHTRAVIMETHERFRAGIDALVTTVMRADFIEQPQSGENRVFLRRPGSAIRARS